MSVRILIGDCRDQLATLPDQSVQTCVTSPPYFGLRDYGTAQWDGGDPACDHAQPVGSTRGGAFSTITGGIDTTAHKSQYRAVCGKCGAVRIDSQLGMEPTLAAYIATLVDVFRDVRRVLRPDGTVWLNIGDSYSGSGYSNPDQSNRVDGGTRRLHEQAPSMRGIPVSSTGLKAKDLMMVPARLAIALQDDGWYLRSDIIWHKRAPMPESCTDRPTSAHEHIFLLTKRPRYFYDADAVREEGDAPSGWARQRANGTVTETPDHRPEQYFGTQRIRNGHGASTLNAPDSAGRNLRNVWTLSPEPFPAAHFATFPTEIPRRAIRAGTSEKGCCAACGAPWRRVVERTEIPKDRMSGKGWLASTEGIVLGRATEPNGGLGRDHTLGGQTTGWQPGCACDADIRPCTVLDPFAGAGTTGLVADELGRDCTLIELNPAYAEMSRERIYGAAPLFAVVAVV
jgi:DNA modification methylase